MVRYNEYTMQRDVTDKEKSLLNGFNNRNAYAFGEVYNLYYTELIYFTRHIYRDPEVNANDVVHDIFVKIWKTDSLVFSGLVNIKAYIIISIKNSLLDYIKHKKQIRKFNKAIAEDPDNFISQIIEAETLSITFEVIKLLPQEMSKVFKLYLEGWEVKDIALKLGKKESTIYAQKRDAISFLKEKLPNSKLLLFYYIFGL